MKFSLTESKDCAVTLSNQDDLGISSDEIIFLVLCKKLGSQNLGVLKRNVSTRNSGHGSCVKSIEISHH
jgi:hypothetical protein